MVCYRIVDYLHYNFQKKPLNTGQLTLTARLAQLKSSK
jgi:hypothetical protein